MSDLAAEDTAHCGHRTWRYPAGTDLEASSLRTVSHSISSVAKGGFKAHLIGGNSCVVL